jgi:hypothetical protein
VTSLPVAPSGGAWTLVQTMDPYRTTAVAAWVDGAPAPGGWAGRLLQARNSVQGGSHAAVLMTVGTHSPERLPPDVQRAVVASITRLIAAQPDLTAEVAALSLVSSRPGG